MIAELVALLRAGASPAEALMAAAAWTRDASVRAALTDIGKSVESGSTLSEAFFVHRTLFGMRLVELLRAAEIWRRSVDPDITYAEILEPYCVDLQREAQEDRATTVISQLDPLLRRIEELTWDVRFARSVGRLLERGVPIHSALEACRELSRDPSRAKALADVGTLLAHGGAFSTALEETGACSARLARIVRTGEHVREAIPGILLRFAAVLANELDEALHECESRYGLRL